MNQFIKFDKPPYSINKPIRLVELFGGIGSKASALRNIGADFEHYRLCEFDKYCVTSYNAIHGTIYQPSDIRDWSGNDLGIIDTDDYEYILTYSFPCQDLSLAGKRAGMTKGSDTRSGLLWELERLLLDCTELPQVLLMENVSQVHGKKNKQDFDKWCSFLSSIGYSNYWQDLNSKNYGVAQNRNRCFMISILGEYDYEFPLPLPLKKKLNDYLETRVDEKYYVSDEISNNLIKKIYEKKVSNTIRAGGRNSIDRHNWDLISETAILQRERGFNEGGIYEECPSISSSSWQENNLLIIDEQNNCIKTAGTIGTIMTDGSSSKHNNRIIEIGKLEGGAYAKMHDQSKRVYSLEGIAPTIHTCNGGKLESKIIDNIYLRKKCRIYDISPTIRAGRQGLKVYDVYNRRELNKDICATLTANGNISLTRCGTYLIARDYARIRKFTARECWRLMGQSDEAFDKARNALIATHYNGNDKANSQLYKQAGNSIVVPILEQIFNNMIAQESILRSAI